MRIDRWIFLIAMTLLWSSSFSQKMYELDWKKELLITGSGGLTFGLGMYLETETTLFTPDELTTLDHNDINAFDRIATGFSSISSHEYSNYFFYGSLGLPALFLAHNDTRAEFGTIALLWGETMLLNGGVTILCKHTFRRPRPFVFDDDVIAGRKLTSNAKASFISGHTSLVAANSFFAAKVYSDYFPDNKWKPYIWGVAATLPAITGYLRIRAGRHYPTDVMAGYAVGALIGWGIPQMHKSKVLKENGLRVDGGLTGMRVKWIF